MRKALLALPLLLWGTHAHAQATVNIAPYFYTSLGYCQITSLSSATPLTTANCSSGSVPNLTSKIIAEICVETAAVRYRDDGVAPTSNVGVPAVPTSSTVPLCFQYSGPLNQIQFIGTGATVDVAFYK